MACSLSAPARSDGHPVNPLFGAGEADLTLPGPLLPFLRTYGGYRTKTPADSAPAEKLLRISLYSLRDALILSDITTTAESLYLSTCCFPGEDGYNRSSRALAGSRGGVAAAG